MKKDNNSHEIPLNTLFSRSLGIALLGLGLALLALSIGSQDSFGAAPMDDESPATKNESLNLIAKASKAKALAAFRLGRKATMSQINEAAKAEVDAAQKAWDKNRLAAYIPKKRTEDDKQKFLTENGLLIKEGAEDKAAIAADKTAAPAPSYTSSVAEIKRAPSHSAAAEPTGEISAPAGAGTVDFKSGETKSIQFKD